MTYKNLILAVFILICWWGTYVSQKNDFIMDGFISLFYLVALLITAFSVLGLVVWAVVFILNTESWEKINEYLNKDIF